MRTVKPATKRGRLRYRAFGADVKDKNLVKKLMIPNITGTIFYAGRFCVFFYWGGGKMVIILKRTEADNENCWQ